MFQVFYGHECALVEHHSEVGEEAVEEIDDVETDARLRTVGIEHPVGVAVFILLAALLQRNDIAAGGAVVVESAMEVTDAGIAVFGAALAPAGGVVAIGVGDVDEGRFGVAVRFHRHLYGDAVAVVLGGLLHGFLFGARHLTDARPREPECLGLEGAADAIVVVVIVAVVFLTLVAHLHLIVVGCRHADVAYLLAYLNLILQRHVAAFEVADEVVEAAGAGVDVHRHAVDKFLIVLDGHYAGVERQTLAIDDGGLAFEAHGTDIALRVVEVVHQMAVLGYRRVEGQGEHLHVVEHGVGEFEVYGLVGAQRHVGTIDLY